MVTSSIDANPLDPDTMYKYGQNTQQAPPKSDLDVIMDRNVAPYVYELYSSHCHLLIISPSSPREVCADLAHQHALDDLHDMTEHASEKHEPMDHSMCPVYFPCFYHSQLLASDPPLMRSDLTEMADLGSSRRSSDRGTQYDEPRKPEE